MNQSKIMNLKTAVKWQFLNATTLKILAVCLMLLDHVHQMYAWVGAPMWLTMLGRPVFPMFLFIAAESFHYTSNRKKYLKRLLFASWGMTILTYIIQVIVVNNHVFLMNNAFSTFFVTTLYMLFWDWFVEGIKNRNRKQIIKAILCCFIPILCAVPVFLLGAIASKAALPLILIRLLAMIALLVPNILTVEGGFAMVALGVFFYIFRKHRLLQILGLLLLSVLVYYVSGGIQWMMCFAVIPMLLYNGEKGRGLKNFFYIFYPAHIVLLYIISTFTAG